MKNYTPRLFDVYKNDIQPILMKKLNIKNVMQLPKIEKIVLNIGMGEARDNKNTLSQAVDELTLITGQKPIITKAKNAISNFKIRAGDPVGVMSTLRGIKMYEFLDRFISISSPRIRDFRGFSSKGFDGRGNYNFGISEQIIFPEIDYDKVSSIRGMNITIVTNSDNDNYAYELLVGFGFPIKELKNSKKSSNNKNELKKVSNNQELEQENKSEKILENEENLDKSNVEEHDSIVDKTSDTELDNDSSNNDESQPKDENSNENEKD